jgi:hypothetical protein
MAEWELSWTYDKANYQPNSKGSIHFSLKNIGKNYLHISEFGLQFDWQKNKKEYYPKDCDVLIPPNISQYISTLDFEIPNAIAGIQTYRVYYHLWEYDSLAENWIDLNPQWSEWNHYIKVIPVPYFHAFASRSLEFDDTVLNEPIVKMIEEWGFSTRTVTEPLKPEDQAPVIKREIKNSDCLILIVIPRFKDALTERWKTFEWGHGETGTAYGIDLPILVLRDERVDLGGLPSVLKDYQISFNPINLDSLRQGLGQIMPQFRSVVWAVKRQRDEIIKAKQKEEFKKALALFGISAGAGLLLGGIAGYLIGRRI